MHYWINEIVKLRDTSPCRIRRFIVSGVFSIILHYVKVKGTNKFVDNYQKKFKVHFTQLGFECRNSTGRYTEKVLIYDCEN